MIAEGVEAFFEGLESLVVGFVNGSAVGVIAEDDIADEGGVAEEDDCGGGEGYRDDCGEGEDFKEAGVAADAKEEEDCGGGGGGEVGGARVAKPDAY